MESLNINSEQSAEPEWHSQEVSDVADRLRTSTASGLNFEEVQKRLDQFGLNQLPEAPGKGPLFRFFIQFHNVLIYVLIAAGVVTLLQGHWVDSAVIFGVVLVNAIIGFIQEGKAEDALRAIREMLSLQAMIIRNQQQKSIPAEQLVPGDVVLLQSGDRIPADLRLFYSKGLQVQESALTGESVAIQKIVGPVDQQSVLGDRLCMAYSGTLVTHGVGSGIVVATGGETQIGRISKMVADVEVVMTPLLRQMAQFGQWLTFAILVIALVTFAIGVLIRDYSVTDMFLASVSLAVAAIPEGLPAIMTITLAIGVQQMAARNAIIRRLPAVETLGAVSVICSDKTGTLTRNEMTVRKVCTATIMFDVEGTGYSPRGVIRHAHNGMQQHADTMLTGILRAGILCNDARLEPQQNEWQVHGDPMEGALLIAGLKAGLEIDVENKNFPRTDLIPFESEHKFMATLHHSHTGKALIYVKGAPERILELCSKQRMTDGDRSLDREQFSLNLLEMARDGQRILAIAIKEVPVELSELSFDDINKDFIMLGLFGLIDPPREEAIEAIKTSVAAGIRVKMITGDHVETARAIASQINLVNPVDAITGQELATITEQELFEKIRDVDVYARVNPEHKLQLVELLQNHGYVVAMTGDGVNDAPALRRSDVGIAMGMNGTEAAKEASEIVLADDNFASIIHAVEEGRTVYDNLKKAILFILPTNGGEALVILAAILLGFPQLPLTPVQILWVNMITAVTLALALAFEPPEKNVMRRPPRDVSLPILSSLLIWRIVFVAVILMSGTFGLFNWVMQQGVSIEYARTVAVNTLVMFEIFYLFNSRFITESVLNWSGLTGNRYVLIAIFILVIFQLLFTYTAPMQQLFGTTAIELTIWFKIIAVASTVLILVELEKLFIRRRAVK